MHPPRKSRWRIAVRVIGLCLALPVLMVLAVRLAWGYESSHRLAAVKAHLRAEGFRCTREEFPDDSDVPPSKNAIPDFLKTISAASFTSAESEAIDPSTSVVPFAELERTPQQATELVAIWASKAPLISALDSLDGRPTVITRSCVDVGHWGSLGMMRETARFLLVMAKIHHAQHREAEALRDVRRILLIARLVDQCPLVIGHLVSIAIRASAASVIEPLEPTLDLRDPAAAAQAVRLIQELDDSSTEEAHQRMFEGELIYLFDNGPSYFPAYQQWWIRPLYEDEICRIAEHYIQVRHVLREQTWQDLRDLGRESDRHRTGSNLSIAAHLLQLQFTSYLERAPELHARCISDSRAAALLLAARLHAARHGTLPQAASELVPGELTQLPVDPFSRPRAPLRFRLDPQGVTVWSLGANGTDEAAAVLFDEFGRKRRRWGDGKPADSPDIVYGAAWRTTTSPTAAASQPVGR